MTAPVNILLVDDHEENLVAVRAILEQPDYRLLSARSGSEALKLLLQEDFALIVLDVRMPIMDGFEVATRIKQRERNLATPIVFLTAEAKEVEDFLQGYAVGAVDYITKPILPELLRGKVKAYAENYRQAVRIRDQEATIEAQKRTAAELAATAQARDEYFSLVSNELKNPLTALNLAIGLMGKEVKKEFKETAPAQWIHDRLSFCLSQSGRLLALIESLLDVSRIKSGRLEVNREQINLTSLLQGLALRLKPQAQEAHSSISLSVPKEPIEGEFDRIRLDQVVTHLISNAIKYGQGKSIEVALSSDDQNVMITVRDRGMGLSKKDQQWIFGRYERAVAQKDFSGMGLGLYITQEIVRAHGGEISVESELGQGSTFSVKIPKRASAEQRLAA